MTPEDFEILRQHVATVPRLTCSVCGKSGWDAKGPFFGMPWNAGPVTIGGSFHAVPLVILTCTTCAHAIAFNWRDILEKTGKGAGDV